MGTTVMVLNGPNLNMLGIREPGIYGSETLADIEVICKQRGEKLGLGIDFRQSNMEGDLVAWIQEAGRESDAIVLNAAAYTHTSIALMDALLSVGLPAIEVHLSNVFRREDFRHQSYISKASIGVICGFGSHGYALALEALALKLNSTQEV